MKHSRSRLSTAVLTLLLIAGIAAFFWRFIGDNTQRIAAQNEEYINELTTQRAISIDSMISENLNFIQSTAYLYGKSLNSSGADVAVIRDYEENSVFDHLRFVDATGDDYTSQGVMANLKDRDYFKAGMAGGSGVTYVLNSRVTNERQIGFYAPVRFGGDIIGIMVGFYGEAYIQRMLEYDLFGYEGEGWLCTRDGTVLGTTVEGAGDNYLEDLRASNAVEADTLARLTDTFAGGGTLAFNCEESDGQATAFAVGLTQADWVLIRTFPPSASGTILKNANREGEMLIGELVIIFAAYGLLLAIGVMVDRRRMQEANRNANDVSTGVSRLFTRFVTLDLDAEEYTYIGRLPDDDSLPPQGSLDAFKEAQLRRVTDDQQRDELKRLFARDGLREALAESDRVSLRVHAPTGGGEWFTYNFIVIERRGDVPSRILVVSQDVTALHHREQEEQRRLQQALDTAERASRAKTEFLFNMSHDIRTPMNAIMGFTGIAATHLDDRARVEDSLGKIEASGKHLLSLINDVLDMSKIESGKLQLNVEDFDLETAIHSLMDMVQPQAKAKRQALELDMKIEHRMIEGDPLRLNQVLLNILSNAVKYTPAEGNIDLRIREYPGDGPEGGVYEFVIRDNGIGMSPDYLPHIFENFTRERTSTVSKIQGTGLGMAITSNLVQLMNGTIGVTSELGVGSEFTVRVPARFAVETAQASEVDDEDLSPERLKGLRLLLAEDNAINAEIAKVILNEAGFEVDWAENGSIALEMVKAGHDRYRAVLMDIQMPVMDGYAASSAVRAWEAEQGVEPLPVIAMTANTFEDDRRNVFDAGMDAHIAKPYEPVEMIRTVALFALHGREEGRHRVNAHAAREEA